MAGVTDSAFRRVIKKLAPQTLLYTEFVSTNALAHGSQKTRAMLEFDPVSERPVIVQVFGADPEGSPAAWGHLSFQGEIHGFRGRTRAGGGGHSGKRRDNPL